MSQSMEESFDTINKFQAHEFFNDLKEIPFTISFDEDTVSLAVWATDILHSNMITIKSIFGPMIYSATGGPNDSKTAMGAFHLDSEKTCKVRVWGAMTCTTSEIAEDGPSAEQIARAIKGLTDGSIKLQDCDSFNNADPSDLCEKRGCFNKVYGDKNLCAKHSHLLEEGDTEW